ncbi:MAG TPA: hypothetical protein VK745_29940 [Polyangiaceae bacterium]|nr:hypothetical protein [Polyangiaceae bacterium]
MAEPPNQRRGSQPYLPPPPETRDDSPESVDVPRMEPPPASLEAMVKSGPSSGASSERDTIWSWLWVALAVGVAVTIYAVYARH